MSTDKDLNTIQFLTCGHVDDGKSTLIGRLLYDIGVVPDDQIEAAKDDDGKIDYSLFTDGLEDERRQGITIDVAYRYFRHDGCRYRIADTPGHLEYMRNMAVAAVSSDIAVILVDAIHGIRLQTVQYSKIARFFGVKQFLVAVNKMDAVEYSQDRFHEIQKAYLEEFENDDTECTVNFVPVSAIVGDNVANKSENMSWYVGPTVLEYLQRAERHTHTNESIRLPIQHMMKDEEGRRWYMGTLHGGSLKIGDKIVSVDSGQTATIDGLFYSGEHVEIVNRRQAVAVRVAEDIDITRGSVLALAEKDSEAGEAFYADILWLDKKHQDKETFSGTLKIHHEETQTQVTIKEDETANDNGPLKSGFVNLAKPIAVDVFESNPHTGLFILIDPYTELAVGVGTVNRVIPMQFAGSSSI